MYFENSKNKKWNQQNLRKQESPERTKDAAQTELGCHAQHLPFEQNQSNKNKNVRKVLVMSNPFDLCQGTRNKVLYIIFPLPLLLTEGVHWCPQTAEELRNKRHSYMHINSVKQQTKATDQHLLVYAGVVSVCSSSSFLLF